MDFTINRNSPAGSSFPIEKHRDGYSLHPEASAFSLRKSNGEMPLHPKENQGFSPDRGVFPLQRNEAGKDLEAERLKLRKAAEGFEAIFIRQFLKTMRSTVSNETMYGSGATGEMYADMVETALADAMAKEERFGIADSLYRRLVGKLDSNTSDGSNISVENLPKAGGLK